MSQLALGVTVFERVNKIKALLKSVNGDHIDRVIIADNGHTTQEKQTLYDSYEETDLSVLDLKYDSGLGKSRQQIVEDLQEEYLLVVDSDIILPDNITELRDQLKKRPDLGGIGGILWEDEQIRSNCYDLTERGEILLRDVNKRKTIQRVADSPLIEFDVIQNVAIFRQKCLDDYCWDPAYTIGWEHTDFFVGQMKKTQWGFGLNPGVVFKHNPGGDKDYEKLRRSQSRLRESKKYFLNKWGYKQVVNGQINWLQSNNGLPSKQDLIEELAKHILLSIPSKGQASLMNMRDQIRYLRGKPPF